MSQVLAVLRTAVFNAKQQVFGQKAMADEAGRVAKVPGGRVLEH